jgi:release factor glutamine methyltransferase
MTSPSPPAHLLDATTSRLRAAGCVAAEEEAAELLASTNGDAGQLEDLVTRRCTGEPLAWLVGSVQFCGVRVQVQPGVYVPRWQSETLATAAGDLLPLDGLAVDLCTGSGAIAKVMATRRPEARILATELDPLAVACARANGVQVVAGDMAAGLTGVMAGTVDVVVAVVPYVPTGALHLLPRDVTTFEPRGALDGGDGGLRFLSQAVREAAILLQPSGWLLLELGGDQAQLLAPLLDELGYEKGVALHDDEGDLRGLIVHRTKGLPPV